MAFQFTKAVRGKGKARVALIGPSGSGKTMSALLIAKSLGSRIALVDTENGSASKYAGEPGIPEFDTLNLAEFSPQIYIEAIRAAEAAGFDVLIIDSLSHAWMGKGGALEMVDNASKRSKSGNSFTAWREVTPHHNALVDALVQCKIHLIVTMRAKAEYVLQVDDRGKQVPKKVGMAPIQREGLDYEFDIVGDIDLDHNYVISKTRCRVLDNAVITKPDEALGKTILAWLENAQDMPTKEQHWSQVEANQKAMEVKLVAKEIPLWAFFRGNEAQDWSGLASVKTGKAAFDKAVSWWEANKPEDGAELSSEMQEALNGDSGK